MATIDIALPDELTAGAHAAGLPGPVAAEGGLRRV